MAVAIKFRLMANIEAHITGNVWKIQVKVGDEVSEEDEVIILESDEDGDPGRVRRTTAWSRRSSVKRSQSVTEGDVPIVPSSRPRRADADG